MDFWDIVDMGLIVFVGSKVLLSLIERERADSCMRPYSRQLSPDDFDSDLEPDW